MKLRFMQLGQFKGMLWHEKKIRFSLGVQLIGLVMVAALLAGGLVSLVMVRHSENALRQQIIANNLAVADLAAELSSRYIQEAQRSLEFLARTPHIVQAVESGNFSQATPDLQEFLRINKWLDDCSLFDPLGFRRATGNVDSSNLGGYSGDSEWFQQAMSIDKPYLSLPLISRATNQPTVPYAIPIRDRTGKVQAVLAGGISLDALADTITGLQTGPAARSSLIDTRQGGIILVHPDRERILAPVSGKDEAVRRLLTGERGAIETYNSSVGELDLASFVPVPDLPWSILIRQPSQTAFAPVAASVRQSIVLMGLLLLLVAAAGIGLARRATRPLVQLREMAEAVTTGDLSKRLNFTRKDELGDLGRSYDHMANALAERTAQLQAANTELSEQNRVVQQANRLKSELLANMSHELRTPLNAIIGFSELIHDGKVGAVSPDQKEYLGDILTSARHLLDLINDVLDLARVEAGKIEFKPEAVKLTKVTSEVRDILRALAASKRIRVSIDVDSTVDDVVTDPARLKQVLYNYLSNALKFSPDETQVAVRARATDANRFRIEVEDTGLGIDPEDIKKLFVEFAQLDSSTTKRHQGTGLGLALTKKIVEAQGGKVGVESIPGRGSTFFAVLPQKATIIAEESTPPLTPSLISRPAVLVIEDNEKDQKWLTSALLEHGYYVEIAASGSAAVERATTHHFNAIVLDLILPDMGGWDVLQAIRSTGPNYRTPVIVVTVVTEREAAKGFAIDDFLVKPVETDMLIDALERSRRAGKESSKINQARC